MKALHGTIIASSAVVATLIIITSTVSNHDAAEPAVSTNTTDSAVERLKPASTLATPGRDDSGPASVPIDATEEEKEVEERLGPTEVAEQSQRKYEGMTRLECRAAMREIGAELAKKRDAAFEQGWKEERYTVEYMAPGEVAAADAREIAQRRIIDKQVGDDGLVAVQVLRLAFDEYPEIHALNIEYSYLAQRVRLEEGRD